MGKVHYLPGLRRGRTGRRGGDKTGDNMQDAVLKPQGNNNQRAYKLSFYMPKTSRRLKGW